MLWGVFDGACSKECQTVQACRQVRGGMPEVGHWGQQGAVHSEYAAVHGHTNCTGCSARRSAVRHAVHTHADCAGCRRTQQCSQAHGSIPHADCSGHMAVQRARRSEYGRRRSRWQYTPEARRLPPREALQRPRGPCARGTSSPRPPRRCELPRLHVTQVRALSHRIGGITECQGRSTAWGQQGRA
jgi:hypothetical protein